MSKGFFRNFRPLEILSEEAVKAVHRGTLEVLETTGVRVEHDRALKLFANHGCRVDFEERRVRIPGWLVEDSLCKCPSSFALSGTHPKDNLRIGGNTMYFAQNVGMRYLDLDSWESRPATLQEHADAVRVLDALDTVGILWPYEFYMEMSDVPSAMMTLEGVASGFRNSTKPQTMGYTGIDDEVFAIKMAKAIGTNMRGLVCAAPPLTYYADACEAAFRFVEAGFPVLVVSGAVMGGTGPATIAGSTIINNAELIAGIVLIQLIKPGTAVQVSDFVFPMDMQRGNPAFGAVGCVLHGVVFEQIWRKYDIPTNSGYGYSAGKKIDFQAGYERAMSALTLGLAGCHVISFHGAVHGELTYHPVMSVLDDDIAGWIGRFMEGVEITDETLAIDLIEEIGPIPGYYLNKEHTRKWWKRERFVRKVADLEAYPEWIRRGKKDALELAKQRVEEILRTHRPEPLTLEQEQAIEDILKEARGYYRERDLI